METQYYVDDMGMQAVTLSYGIDGPKHIPPSDVKEVEKIREDSLGPYQFGSTIVQHFDWARKEKCLDALRNEEQYKELIRRMGE